MLDFKISTNCINETIAKHGGFMRVLLLLFLSIHLIGCQTIIENHNDFEANQVISRTTISDNLVFPLVATF